jgi:lipid-A-disaccharide synthase-like uncharacterized protein
MNWHDGFTDGKFLWVHWELWKAVGWAGNVAFTARFLVQWYATEKHKQVVVPLMFWWLSIAGSWLILAYSISRKDAVFIVANLFNWIPYVRNLVIQRRHKKAHLDCPKCATVCPPNSRFCFACGADLNPAA